MKALLWIFIAIITGLYITIPVIDPDLWWHIAIGRWILATGEVPVVEHWNLFGLGKPFRAYSWMFEVIAAKIDSSFGVDGLFYTKVLLGQLLSFTLFFVFSRISRDWFFGLLLGIIGVVCCHSHFTLRPQSITWIYFALVLFFTDRAVRRDRVFPDACYIFLLLALWANIHITTVLALGAIFFWAADKERITLTSWLIFFGAVGTLLTPYFGAEWLTFFSKTGHPLSFSSIAEFQPATLLQYTTGFVVLIVAVLGMLFYYHQSVFPTPRLVFAGILLLGGLAVVKFLPIAAIFLIAVVAASWREANELGYRFGNLTEAFTKFRELFNRIPPEGLGFILICLIIVLGQKLYFGEKIGKGIVPIDAVEFMEEKELAHPWLHNFGYGGYLMRHFTEESHEPRELVVIDGRTNVAPKEVMEIFMEARSGGRNWRKLLDITEPQTILWVGDSAFISLLLLTKEWCSVYEAPHTQLEHTVLIPREIYENRLADFPDAVCE